MKKLTLFLIAFVMAFTSCKPEPEGNENNGSNSGEANKVKVSCSIPINKDTRSDFTGLFEDGVINWSNGRECVYLAIPGDEPKVVELEGYCDGYKPEIEFIAYVDENLLTAGKSYDIWYFGHSQQLDSAYVSLVDGNKIEGSIAKQTGRLEDLGYSHIASTSVKAVMENGKVKLPLAGTLKNRMAIALLDLENLTTGLFGSAVNTDYTLEYNAETGRYEFNVIEDENASIKVEPAKGISYIAFLPNENNKVELRCRKYADYEYVFYNGIKENKIYYRLDENENVTNLTWNAISPNVNGYEYVDLGLPSGVKWAKYNAGVTIPEAEEYGSFYTEYTAIYDNINWEGWRKTRRSDWTELKDNCTWLWTTQNEVNGYKVIGPNGNSIFLPAAGYSKSNGDLYNIGEKGYYWGTGGTNSGYYFYFDKNTFGTKVASSDYIYTHQQRFVTP